MADVTINLRARDEATPAFIDFSRQLESVRRLLAEGVATAVGNSIEAFAAQARQAVDTREHIEGLAEAQETLNQFWRVASGQLPDYASEIERVDASVIDLAAAERALSEAVAANVDLISVAIEGEREKQTALDAAVAVYERTELATRAYELSVLDSAAAAVEAERRIAAVGRAINAADPSRAEARLRDYDDAFALSEVTIPRVASAMREFTGTLSPAESEIAETTRELENLSAAARDAARDADFLSASVSDIEAFDPRTPGRASRRSRRGFDFQGFALRQGDRFASAAIGIGGDLLQAEEQRVESLEALERRTSERIADINERKAARLADISRRIEQEERRRIAAIEQAFEEAKDAEIAAREAAATEIAAIQASALEETLGREREHYQELRGLEADLADDIARIREGFADREARRQAEIVEVTERSAADRVAAEARYQQRVIEINRGLVDSVRALREELSERLAELDAGLAAREAERAAELVAIERAGAEARLAAEGRYAQRVIEINRDLVLAVRDRLDAIAALESGLAERLSELASGLLVRESERADRLVEIEQSAVEERLAAEERYAQRVVEINRGLVLAVRDRLTEIAALETGLAEQLSELDAGFVEREAERAAELVAIATDAADDRLEAASRYADRVADVNRDLVRDVREVQADIVRIEREAVRAREDVISEATAARRDAASEYAGRVQGIYSDLAGDIEGIERDLTRRLDRIRDQRLASEEDRVQALARLQRGTRASVEDRRLELGRDIEDILIENDLRDDLSAERLGRTFSRASLTERDRVAILGTYSTEILREVADLQREYLRDIEDIERESGRERVEIAEAFAREQAELDAERVSVESDAAVAREAAETGAGVDAATALANAVPALSAMEQAALAFSEAIAGIDAQELERLQAIETESVESLAAARAEIAELETAASVTFQTALESLVPEVDATTQALNDLNAALSEIAADTQARRGTVIEAGALDREGVALERAALTAETGAAVAGLRGEISGLESDAGISFEAALENFVPEIDATTAALNDLNAALSEIATNLGVARSDVLAEGAADREGVTVAEATLRAETGAEIAGLRAEITDLESAAGTTFAAALSDFVPEVDASTAALNAFNAALAEITADVSERRGAVIAAGVSDREGVALERAGLISETDAAIAELEAGAGISFQEALAGYVPALDATTAALNELNTTLASIASSESAALSDIRAEGVSDREAVDAAIAERRAQFDIDYQEASLQYQDDLATIQYAAAQQIIEVNANLSVLLGEIDATLSETLAAIRANKIEFDNAIFAEIREIEANAAAELAAVRSESAAMRTELEAIAEEARNNAWKKGLLRMANVGVTIAGVAIGAAVAGPAGAAAGAQIGGIVGGLIEEGGDELFHDAQNDLLAFRAGQQSARGTSRAFSPDTVQRQNAEDFSRYFGEGYASERERQGGSDGGSERPVVVQLVLNDRVLQEMSVRLSELRGQDRVV